MYLNETINEMTNNKVRKCIQCTIQVTLGKQKVTTSHVSLNSLIDITNQALELVPLLHGQHHAFLRGLQLSTGIVEFPYVNVPLSFKFGELDEPPVPQLPRVLFIFFLRLFHRRSLGKRKKL